MDFLLTIPVVLKGLSILFKLSILLKANGEAVIGVSIFVTERERREREVVDITLS